MIKKIFFSVILILTGIFSAHATHNRAGEITYRCIGPLQYEVTITTYTKVSGMSSQADRQSLDSVHWGDGATSVFPRVNGPTPSYPGVMIATDIKQNVYRNTHTYPGHGTFDIYFEDPNRNADVVNIPGSVNVPFFVHTILVANPYLGACDNSPILLQPPIDRGCTGVPFIHNPDAFDPDPNDSLSYVLTDCLGAGGQVIPGFTYPSASVSLTLNPVTGDLVWNSPVAAGEYNIAFLIQSWRDGTMICSIERDMQIVIGTCNNNPPEITPMPDTCVIAGDTLSFAIHATDPDGDLVDLTSTGGPYMVTDPAVFTPPPFLATSVTGYFDWITQCHHIRKQPYHVQFKAEDNSTPVHLVDLKGRNIYVIGPAPTNPTANPSGNSIVVQWDPSVCSNAIGYAIYRKTGIYPGTIECPCQTGVPASTGYVFIDSVSGLNNTTYTDNDHGNGLIAGNEYCYIIVALYPDGSESCASPQVCSKLKKDLPVITNASVNTTDITHGSMYVAWSKPTELDTVQFPPPYEYRVYHSNDFFGGSFSQFAIFHDLNDTTVVDTILNTFTAPWSYKIELYYNNSGTPAFKGSSQKASSIYLSLSPTDNRMNLSWKEYVPWTNTRYDIFRLDTSVSLSWDSIASTTFQTYSDTGLTNGNQYCYHVRSVGSYSSQGFVNPILNYSQDTCSVPYDNVAPCSPVVQVTTDCIDQQNGLTWNNPNLTCADDVQSYHIYYFSPATNDYELIAVINDPNTTSYIHTNLASLAGCYKVTAIDSTGNESTGAVEFCVDTCREYVLPSVFTPNGDGLNDLFHPCDQTTDAELQMKNCPPYKNVKDVDMKIFNRWGNLVFQTNDKDINWNGKNKDSGKDCPGGVYYYICKVNFYRLNGTETKDLHGYFQLMREK
ncbi:MAG: gliding motility-associated C-terminal domain-containing protein [Bacteroidetes bacterium]|nr:gliding motility-associated C-terminal domain-containing protein [Bacteroidota bacterium]